MDFSKLTLQTLDGLISFCPTAKQKLFLNTITETNVSSVLTRQQGFSTVQCISIVQHALDVPGSTSVLVTHNNRMNVLMISRIREILVSVTSKLNLTRITKNRIELRNGSVITMASPQNAHVSIRGIDIRKMYVAVDILLERKNLYEMSLLIQQLIQMGIKFSIGMLLHPPRDVSKKVMKIFNVKLTLFMTMLRYNSTFVDFPVIQRPVLRGYTIDEYKQEYELFSYSVLNEDPSDQKIEP